MIKCKNGIWGRESGASLFVVASGEVIALDTSKSENLGLLDVVAVPLKDM